MLSKVNTAALYGLNAMPVVVETDITRGMPGFYIVGLADVTIKEARERIRSAIINSGYEFPVERIVINISPADIRKKGSYFDLPMAMGILADTRQIMTDDLESWCFIGELSLDGRLKRVNGVLSMLTALKENSDGCDMKKIVIPSGNAKEAGLVADLDIYYADRLSEVLNHFNMKCRMCRVKPWKISDVKDERENICPDFYDVKGQEAAKRAIMVAASGGHGLLMTGSPSTGKTMLAERIPNIMPKLNFDEILEITRVYSVSGRLSESNQLVTQRPFRRPHHRITGTSLIGGGMIPVPGEITLANKGVLFLDELGEFNRNVIDLLRQPLEEKKIDISRLGNKYTYPADFLLVAATNPCKCGYYGDAERECTCSAGEVERYRNKISGPIMDRIDLHIRLHNIKYEEYRNAESLDSKEMRKRIETAREIQDERFQNTSIRVNAQMNIKLLEKYVSLGKYEEDFLQSAYINYKLNPRTLTKIKKVARTVADLRQSDAVELMDLSEAIQYREDGLR